jgi:hypothetical protein
MLANPSFAIKRIEQRDEGLWRATVEMVAAKAVAKNDEHAETVNISVIATIPDGATLEYLQEAIVAAAAARLSLALRAIEGRTAKDLLASATPVELKVPFSD